MILANYFSAWVGFLYLWGGVFEARNPDVHHAWSLTWKLVGIAYLVTLVLE